MGSGQKFLTWVGPGQFLVARVGSGWVSHLWFGFGFGKFPLKRSNFSIFALWVKRNLFGLGQKCPRVGLGQFKAHLKFWSCNPQSQALVLRGQVFLTIWSLDLIFSVSSFTVLFVILKTALLQLHKTCYKFCIILSFVEFTYNVMQFNNMLCIPFFHNA